MCTAIKVGLKRLQFNARPGSTPAIGGVANSSNGLGWPQNGHDLKDSGGNRRSGEGCAQRLGDLSQLRLALFRKAANQGLQRRRLPGHAIERARQIAQQLARLGRELFGRLFIHRNGPGADIEHRAVSKLGERLGTCLQPIHTGTQPRQLRAIQ